jgi:hypothetical protein
VNAHKELVSHEAGHCVAGMLSGLRPHRVSAPPLPDWKYALANPHEQAGVCSFYRGERRALGIATLAGMLASYDPLPSWPLDRPRTNDERVLAETFAETDELYYNEAVRDAERLVSTKTFTRLHDLVSELLTHPPHELAERELVDLHKLVNELPHAKSHEAEPDGEDPAHPDTDCERDELGVVSDEEIENDIQALNPTNRIVMAATNGHAPIKAVRTRLDLAEGLLDDIRATQPVPIQTFDA